MEKVALTCTPPCVKNSTGEELLYNTGALCDGLEGAMGGGEEGSRGRGYIIITADSHCYPAETNTAL